MSLFVYVYQKLLGRSVRLRLIHERAQERQRARAVRRLPIPELR